LIIFIQSIPINISQLVFRCQENTGEAIDISSLASGRYTIRIQNNQGSTIRPFVKI